MKHEEIVEEIDAETICVIKKTYYSKDEFRMRYAPFLAVRPIGERVNVIEHQEEPTT